MEKSPGIKLSIFNSKLFPILLVNFLGILGYSLMLPILIFIVADFGGNGFIYGLIGATYPLFQFIGAPKLGRLSDRVGRKKVLIITQLGSFLAWSLFLLAFFLPRVTLWSLEAPLTGQFVITLPLLLLFIARMIDGYTGGNISVANAYISDVSTNHDRSKNFGLIGTSTSLGLAVGPAASALLAATFLGELLPLGIAAAAAILTAILINKKLKESNPCVEDRALSFFKNFKKLFQSNRKNCFEEDKKTPTSRIKNNWTAILSIRGMSVMYLIYFLTYFGVNLFSVSLPVYASIHLNWSVAELGIFLAYYSFMMMMAQGPLLAKLVNLTSSIRLILVGAILLAIGFSFLVSQNMLSLYLAISIMAIGNGIMWPSFLALLSQMGSARQRGVIQGYGASMGSMASMAGLILGGVFFELWGTTVFFLGAGIFVLVALIVWFRFTIINLGALKGH